MKSFLPQHRHPRTARESHGMAATVLEGTARKLVTCKCGRTMTNSEDRGDSRKDGTKTQKTMSCHTKETLENMLEDVVNELHLSEGMIEEHGPLGTPPAELVRLVLQRKDQEIAMLRSGFKGIYHANTHDMPPAGSA